MVEIVMKLKSFCQIANIYNYYSFSFVTDKHPYLFFTKHRDRQTDRHYIGNLFCDFGVIPEQSKLRSLGLFRKNIEPTPQFPLNDARIPGCPLPSAQLDSNSDPSRATCMMASVETAAEHERILREIESTDTNCIGPTLR